MACHAPAGRLIHQRRSIPLFLRLARPPPRSVLPILCRFGPEGTAPSLSRWIGKAPSASKVLSGPAGLVGLLALAVVDLFEVGVHHFLVAAGLAIAGAAASPSMAVRSSAMAASAALLSAGETLSWFSFRLRSVVWISPSAWLRASTAALRFLSSAAWASA